MKCPVELYVASPRRYEGLSELTYPFHGRDVLAGLPSRSKRTQPAYAHEGFRLRPSGYVGQVGKAAFARSLNITDLPSLSSRPKEEWTEPARPLKALPHRRAISQSTTSACWRTHVPSPI
jgi:hypothetical protein